jgi:hypothetical protein
MFETTNQQTHSILTDFDPSWAIRCYTMLYPWALKIGMLSSHPTKASKVSSNTASKKHNGDRVGTRKINLL